MYKSLSRIGVALVSWVAAASGPALAQDATALARHGDIALAAGFAPDPHEVTISTGGDLDAAALSSACDGLIGEAPDLRVQYSAASAPRTPLVVSAQSSADISLLVSAPDGAWYCSTDGLIRFGRPQSGAYAIWVAAPAAATEAALTLSATGP
ncbi:MAG: hypothetical protein JNM59_06695 [Hyphomonadaceae bacterium]|nr:hypothetical protein [Hyphomonadaceae bacterium]